MDQNNLELVNLITDFRRAVLEHYYQPDITPNTSNFISSILANYPNLIKIDPQIKNYIKLDLLKNTTMLPLEKAEYLLMTANQLQNYLLK